MSELKRSASEFNISQSRAVAECTDEKHAEASFAAALLDMAAGLDIVEPAAVTGSDPYNHVGRLARTRNAA